MTDLGMLGRREISEGGLQYPSKSCIESEIAEFRMVDTLCLKC
jgi:hypothetical protein